MTKILLTVIWRSCRVKEVLADGTLFLPESLGEKVRLR